MTTFDPRLLGAADYVHPREVAGGLTVSLTQPQQILSAWASDACAVESPTAVSRLPGTPRPVALTSILSALKSLNGAGVNPALLLRVQARARGVGRSLVEGLAGSNPHLQPFAAAKFRRDFFF